LTKAAPGDAERLLDFFSGATARALFEEQGFIVVGRPGL
jgi:hypothetical protein